MQSQETRVYKKMLSFLRSLSSRIDSHEAILILFMVLYTAFFSYVTIRRMQALQTYAYDLGNYNQALYTTFARKGLLYYTADLLANPSGSIFGVHISIDLLIILPIYALFPAPESLLVMQATALALGALPVYLLAKLKLNSKNLAFAFAAAYLLNPELQGVNWYDFHPESFIILPMLFAMYLSEKREWLFYFLSLFFVLFAIDKAALLVGAFALYKLVSLRKDEVLRIRHGSSSLVVHLTTFVIAVAWFSVAAWVVSTITPLNVFVSGASQNWSYLGARNLIQIPARVIFSPNSAINALAFESSQKLCYIILLLGPLLFLPILAPKTLVLFLPWLAVSLLSNYPPYYQLGTQYPAYVLPAAFYGSVIGASKLVKRFEKSASRLNKTLGGFILTSTLLFLVASGPLSTAGIGRYPLINYGFPEIPSQSSFVTDFINIIPRNASILAQSNLFPLVSDRASAYVMPASVFYPPGTNFLTSLRSLLEKIDYLLIDLNTGSVESGILLSQPMVKDKFGLLASGDGVMLLQKGYTEKPLFSEPYERTFNYRNLLRLKGATTVRDPESRSQIVLFHSGVTLDDFWYGPYVCLPPGKYEAAFRLKIGQQAYGGILNLRVSSFQSTIWATILGNNETGYHLMFSINQTGVQEEYGSRLIYGENFTVDKYEEFVIDFNVERFGVYEFTGMDVRMPIGLYLDEIRVYQVEPGCTFNTDLRFLGN